MKNWIFYKDQHPVNMGSIGVVGKTGALSITFYVGGETPIMRWIFDSEVECNLVYKYIKDQMTEIKLDYHPDMVGICQKCEKHRHDLFQCEICDAWICDDCQADFNEFTQIDYNCCKSCAKYV